MTTPDGNENELQRIFLEALELKDVAAREKFLEESCAGDLKLRKAVKALFRRYEASGNVEATLATLPAAGGDCDAAEPDSQGGALFVPGRVLADRYRIVALLGKGGMGEVYRADDLKLEQPVALKFLPEGLDRDQSLLKALYNEVRQARMVSHRHVCRVYDIGEAEGRHFLSMEYIEGEDLGLLLRRIGRLSVDKVIELGRQLCSGLQAAHEEGLLHLDLKPGNVMIDGRGDVRITDFGLARLSREAGAERRRAGTPAYMAPEQLLEGIATERSDVYAVGLVLYEMVAGGRIHTGRTLEDIVRWHENEGTPDPPSLIVPNLDRNLEAVILQCLDADPGNRPGTIGEILDRLGGQPVEAVQEETELPTEELERSDVYIAYSPVDDEPLISGRQGWISQFHRNLETRLAQISGEEIKVFRDSAPQDEERVEQLVPYLPDVKAMVSVVSPPFLHSRLCLRTLEAFREGAGRSGGTVPLVKAVKTPVPDGQVPPELAEVLKPLAGFDFFEVDESGRVREFDESFGPAARQRYFERLYDLAQEVNQMVHRNEGEEKDDEGSGKIIYLGGTTSDQSDNRDRIRRELVTRGHTVLPDRALPMVAAELRDEVTAMLERCDLAIHPIGARYGIVPEGADRSLAQIENELAAEVSARGLQRVIWIPRETAAEDPRQQAFIEALREEPGHHLGAEILRDTVEDLKEYLMRRLDPEAEKAGPDAEVAGDGSAPRRVYLLCDPKDENAIEGLEDYLFEEGFEISLPDFEADEQEAAETHRENLRDCDAVIVFYGAARHTWVDIKLRGLMKAAGYGRTAPLAVQSIYIAPPFDRRKERFRTHSAEVIRQEGEFEPALMEDFVRKVRTL